MTSPSEQLAFQVEAMRTLVAGIQPDQWANPTACDKWTVRDVVNHITAGGQMFAASFRGETIEMDPEAPEPDVLGDDPLGALEAMIAAFQDAVSSPGAMERDAVLPFATLPAQVALDIAKFDLLLHCHDIAAATGQPFDPPADVMAEAKGIAEAVVPGLRDGSTFGEELTAPEGASEIEQLAAFSGRRI